MSHSMSTRIQNVIPDLIGDPYKKNFYRFLIMSGMAILCAAFLLLPAPSSAATLVSGDLIKLLDDGNPATQHDTAVYYYGQDGRRYVFPNDKVYFTWYSDFSGVKEIDSTQMASITIGGNVTYKPGVRMVKIVSSPKVYAISKNGTLRPIGSEQVAIDLFGIEWNKLVDDIPDAFFVNYNIGADVNTASAYNRDSELAVASSINNDKNIGSGGSEEPPPPPPPPVDRANFEVDALGISGNAEYVRGTTGVDLASFQLKAASTATNVVKKLVFQGYVDEREGENGFGENLDNDNGTATFVSSIVGNISMYDLNGNKLAGPKGPDSAGKVTFDNLNISISPGQTLDIVLRGDLSDSLEVETTADLLSFDIKDVSEDVTVTDTQGQPVEGTGTTPNGGTSPTHFATIHKVGTVSFEWNGLQGFGIAGREVHLGSLLFDVKYDDYDLQHFTVSTIGLLESIDSYKLELIKSDMTTETHTFPFLGTETTISNIPFILEKDHNSEVRILAKLKPQNNDFYNERIQMDFRSTDPLKMVSAANGKAVTEIDLTLDPNSFPIKSTKSDVFVRFTDITFSLDSASPSGTVGKNSNQEVMRFSIKAEPEGGARIKQLTFKLTPSDTDIAGTPNDALEQWADVNGDGPDDNDLVNLWDLSKPGEDPIGEDQTARIKYSVVKGGAEDDTPSGITSGPNDYGLVTYIFNLDQEIKIPAGETRTFRFEIDTTEFAIGTHELEVDIVGESRIQWTDLFQGNYTPITGIIVNGLPLEGHDLTVQ